MNKNITSIINNYLKPFKILPYLSQLKWLTVKLYMYADGNICSCCGLQKYIINTGYGWSVSVVKNDFKK